MSKLPEAVIEAAMAKCDDAFGDYKKVAAERARLVILTLAKELPESAVEEACRSQYSTFDDMDAISKEIAREEMRAAIVAALEDVGGE